MPELSVLLPARNAAATIAEAVGSTLRAMPADAELLVLDDASTDATAERASAGAEAVGRGGDLRILTTSAPGGVAAGLNRLLAASDSRFVGRMDADDVSLRGRFAAGLRAIGGGDDFVFTAIATRRGRLPRPYPPVAITPEAFPVGLLLSNPVTHPTMVARRSSIEALGGYRGVPAEDYDLWLRAAAAGQRLRRLARWGLIYRLHPGQVTASQDWVGQSWRDPQQAQAFADLAEQVVGERLRRLVAIAALPSQQRAPELRRFQELVEPAVRRVPGPYGILLRRRLKARLSWAAQAPTSTREREGR